MAAIKQQMLAVLIEAVGKPSTASGQAQTVPAPTPAQPLAIGETVTATVIAARPNGDLVLSMKGQAVLAAVSGSALPPAAQVPGAMIRLKVETAGQTPRLAMLDAQPPPATAASTAPPAQPAPPAPLARPVPPAPPAQPAAAPAAKAALQSEPVLRIIAPRADAISLPERLSAVIARTTAEAAGRQGSAAPLYANLAELTARPDAPLPRPVAVLAEAILSQRIDGERPVTANQIRQAVAQSGLLQESATARGGPPPLDAKALLSTLKELLRADALRFVPAAPDAEPPRYDSPVTAQKAVAASLAGEKDPALIAGTLAREADQATERVKLHQIASLPDPRPAPGEPARPQQLSFEIPIAFAQQTAMAGFRIEREKRRKAESGQPIDIWGVRFAIDAEGIGPVHAHVRLAGQTVSVSLWAEDKATYGAFLAAVPMLEAALAESALDIGDVAVFAGRPAETRRAEAGRFLDRST
ncbi:MAG: flagellar hook-length control protein FliK [Methylocystis sp.]|nr:flagellar hook-length control protein FliK [Methylocystis sp.]MCA3586152.1 flagellar hook-length control protein FliK [Methylocystis sp.]MCA3589095.1 flagellar hook-length control protein FliK [Methylocystis sp.]MCA3592888.1 flagellar hook-length control protein FliK [Methylocystis sp.]